MRFVFDECLPDKFPRALQVLGEDAVPYSEHWERGTPDEQWIPVAALEGWVIITADKLRPHRRLALSTQSGRIFLLAVSNLSTWEQFRLLVNRWQAIKQKARKTKPPYIWRVPKKGQLAKVIV